MVLVGDSGAFCVCICELDVRKELVSLGVKIKFELRPHMGQKLSAMGFQKTKLLATNKPTI